MMFAENLGLKIEQKFYTSLIQYTIKYGIKYVMTDSPPNSTSNLTSGSSARLVTGENKLFINGPAGQLEVLTHRPATINQSVIAVICHPHPLFGGTMHNKVVYTVARAFKDMGIATVRFNFRGVGLSTGSYDAGMGETDDLIAILAWLNGIHPDYRIWLAGFSFGSYVAARATKQWSIEQLISIGPPVQNFNFKELPPFNCPWLVIQGDADEIVSPEAVFSWLDGLSNPPQLIRMQGASHFFHGRLIELREEIINALS